MSYVAVIKTLVTIASTRWHRHDPEGVPEKIQQNHQKKKSYHDRKVVYKQRQLLEILNLPNGAIRRNVPAKFTYAFF